eukprot:jgi/Galph1/4063/GphlegSOOS_G2763.1
MTVTKWNSHDGQSSSPWSALKAKETQVCQHKQSTKIGWKKQKNPSYNMHCLFKKERIAADSVIFVENQEYEQVWLKQENTLHIYGFPVIELQTTLPSYDYSVTCVKPICLLVQELDRCIQLPLIVVGWSDGSCSIYHGKTGTCQETLQPVNSFSGSMVIAIGCDDVCKQQLKLATKEREQQTYHLLIGYEGGHYALWSLYCKANSHLEYSLQGHLKKKWTDETFAPVFDIQYDISQECWIAIGRKGILMWNGEGINPLVVTLSESVRKLIITSDVCFKKTEHWKSFLFIITKEGRILFFKSLACGESRILLEPLEYSSFVSGIDFSSVECLYYLCCGHFVYGSKDGYLYLIRMQELENGKMIMACLVKLAIHWREFDIIHCKKDRNTFTIFTFCAADAAIACVSVSIRHLERCCLYKEPTSNNRLSLEQGLEISSLDVPCTSFILNEHQRTASGELGNDDDNNDNRRVRESHTEYYLQMKEMEERFRLLQLEYEQERKIHERLRNELLERALQAESLVEKLRTKGKEWQYFKERQAMGSLKEYCSVSPKEESKIASLEQQLAEAVKSKNILLAQTEEDMKYLESRVEALDVAFINSQQTLESFIGQTIEMNERIAEVLDGLTDDAFEQLGGFEDEFREWMSFVLNAMIRQKKRTEELKEEIHTLRNMFRVMSLPSNALNGEEQVVDKMEEMKESSSPRIHFSIRQIRTSFEHRISELEEQLKQKHKECYQQSDMQLKSFVKELEQQLEQAEQRIHSLEEEREHIAIAHDRLLEDNAALETENERLQLQLRRAVEAASYYSGREVASALEPTTPKEDENASGSSKG